MKKQIIFAFSIVVVALVTILITILSNTKSFEITTIKKQYCFVVEYEKKQEFEVLIYVSNKKSYFSEKSYLNSAYIKNDSDSLLLEIISVKDKNQKTKIKNKDFYLYGFVFNIPFTTSSEYELDLKEAVIELNYKSITINISIGSFYYYKVPYYNDLNNNLSITNLKGIVTTINHNKTLGALYINFKNNLQENINIDYFKILESNITISAADIKKVTEPINPNDNLYSILGYNYNFYSQNIENFINLEIKGQEETCFVVPLKYLHSNDVSTLGFLIEYSIGSKNYKYYQDDFSYFTDLNYFVNQDMLEIQKYENS